MRLSWFRLGFLREQCGAAAAEFAMVVLPMTVFSFAIIQMGSLLFLWNDMNSAAREGVRALVVDERLDITDDGSVLFLWRIRRLQRATRSLGGKGDL